MLKAPWSHGSVDDLAFTLYAVEIEEREEKIRELMEEEGLSREDAVALLEDEEDF